MKSWHLPLALAILVSCYTAAQDPPRKNDARQSSAAASRFSKRAVSLIGTVSDDGQFLIADPHQDVWAVSNSQATKPFAGQRIAVLAQTASDKAELHVLSVKAAKDRLSTIARWSDSAFRR